MDYLPKKNQMTKCDYVVEQLKEQYPQAQLVLMMGSDMFLSFHTWKHPEKILENASLAVFYRGDRHGRRFTPTGRKCSAKASG